MKNSPKISVTRSKPIRKINRKPIYLFHQELEVNLEKKDPTFQQESKRGGGIRRRGSLRESCEEEPEI